MIVSKELTPLHPVDEVRIHVCQDGPQDAAPLVLIHALAASTRWWDALVPLLSVSHRVIRVDLLGHGKSAKPTRGDYGIAVQARRVGAEMDRLGVQGAIIVGHSTGGSVATALAEQRRHLVKGLVLIDSCPSLDAAISPGIFSDLLVLPVVGRLLWWLLTTVLTRKLMTSGFAAGYAIPQPLVDDMRAMPYHPFSATVRAAVDYLSQRSLPERLALLGTALLVIFGEEDQRCRSSYAADQYRTVPGAGVEVLKGIGHSPMVEDPRRTAALVEVFAASIPRT
jgi:pimeloyl-ACP methyl ester carboxylesterase